MNIFSKDDRKNDDIVKRLREKGMKNRDNLEDGQLQAKVMDDISVRKLLTFKKIVKHKVKKPIDVFKAMKENNSLLSY